MLDDLVNPYLRRRRALSLARYLRRALAFALMVVVVINLFLLLGPGAPGSSLVEGVRISLGLCLATAVCGSFIGMFLACVPLARLPYLYKLPLASLAGTVLVQSLVAAAHVFPLLLSVVG